MSYVDITDKDRQAIEKKELDEYDQRKLRGTGYQMMTVRDQGWGKIMPELTEGKDVTLEWHVEHKDDEFFPDYSLRNKLPPGKFRLTIGKESVVVDSNAFQKLLRWC